MDVLIKRKISRLENEVKKLTETNDALRAEVSELNNYIEENNLASVESNLDSLKEAQEKFNMLNNELEKCRKDYKRQLEDIQAIKMSMIKDFNSALKKEIKKTK